MSGYCVGCGVYKVYVRGAGAQQGGGAEGKMRSGFGKGFIVWLLSCLLIGMKKDFLKEVEKKYQYKKDKTKLESAANVIWGYKNLLRFLGMLAYFFGYSEPQLKLFKKK